MHALRNNLAAGVFVLASVALAVWVSFMLADRSGLTASKNLVIAFPLDVGAHGIKRNSPVLLAGQQVGRVLDVKVDIDSKGVPTGIRVDVEIDDRYTVFDNAVVALERPLLGSLSSINISSVGGSAAPGEPEPKPISQGGVLKGGLAPPAFLAQAGIGPQQVEDLKLSLTNLRNTLDRAAALLDEGGDVRASVAGARELIEKARQDFGTWSEQVSATLANARTASEKLDPLMADVSTGVEEARAVVKRAGEGVDAFTSVIEGNREKVNEIVANIENISRRVDRETIDLVNSSLADARDAIRVFTTTIDDAQGLLGTEAPGIRRTLANLRLVSEQLKLTAIEVRSQPWRLLHTPDTKELREQVIYDAARSFAEAASDVRASTEALRAAATPRVPGPTDAQRVQDAAKELEDSVVRYGNAEKLFLEALIRLNK